MLRLLRRPRTPQIQRRDLTRLSRILELLSSDHAGERAAAATAATAFIKKHDLTWLDILEGGAMPMPKGTPLRRHKLDPSDDDLKAAESRLRQMQAHNLNLERQNSRLKNQLEAIKLGADLERS
jgi:hypothetical protein